MNKDDIVTPINVRALEFFLRESKYDESKSAEILRGFKYGFDIGYRGPVNRQDVSANLPLTIGSLQDIWDKLMKEVKLGRYAGPYTKIPYDNYIQSPIGLVPKASNQMRLIFHLSYDFGPENHQKSLNFHTPEDCCLIH